MLNRVAESFYWIGRYMERVDFTTRLIDINYHAHHILLEKENSQEYLQKRLLAILDVESPYAKKQTVNMHKSYLLDIMTFDHTYDNSILSSLGKARHNVRIIREQIPEKIWDTINCFYLWFTEQGQKKVRNQLPYSFFEQIRNEVSLFHGITDSTMMRDNEWNFIQAGRLIERAGNSIRILQLFCDLLVKERDLGHKHDDYHRLISILESVDGAEAFRKCHANEVKLDRIIDFLLLNKVFPRSVSFSLTNLEMYLNMIQNYYHLDSFSNVNRHMSGIKVNFLAYPDLEDLTINQLQSYLNELLMNCNQLGMEIEKCFFYGDGGEITENSPQRKVALV